ncbi:hypothetical protein QA635_13280 [Bradyrhizobium brasilense]|uniref:hypothetical protein n=1 Tax=Bradyrhizobium brasilense TaxID=1419277 RepID=UPI0024B11AFC|nr:hypothetical protein [Bradyrhizobium australafricanum]WFU35322.1 hypothetical protein QA635_13280 [Bradyrhizobium australafricanum]
MIASRPQVQFILDNAALIAGPATHMKRPPGRYKPLPEGRLAKLDPPLHGAALHAHRIRALIAIVEL